MHRVLLDDTDAVKDALALTLMRLVEPENAVTWDLIPFWPEPIRQLTYEIGQRSISPREVVLQSNFETDDTEIVLTAATKVRVTGSHVLYHPATKQRIQLDAMTQSTGTATIRTVEQASDGSRTQIDAGQTLYILSSSEMYEEINSESRQEDTDTITNYIQDTTELLRWSVADMREGRKFGIDRQLRLAERMRDIVKDLNLSLIYNKPVGANGTKSAMTAGFDYLIEEAGNVVDATESGLADVGDLRAICKILQKKGVGPSDGIVMHSSVDVYHAYLNAGLTEVQIGTSPGTNENIGNIVGGLMVPALGVVPFVVDPFINDDRVRFIATKHYFKAYYQGNGEGAVLEAPRVIDEESMSNSKVKVSSFQQKWGTVLMNAGNAHYILDNTGLNG